MALARVTAAVGLGARWPGQVALVRADGSVVGSLLGGAFDTATVADVPGLDPRLARRARHRPRVRPRRGRAGRAPVRRRAERPRAAAVGDPGQRAADLAARRPTALLTELDDPAFATRAVSADGDPAYADEGSPDSVARSLLARGEPSDAVVETAAGRVLVSVVLPTPHLVVIGSGALASALEAQLALLGWACSAITHADDGVAAVRALGPGDGVLVIDHRGEVDLPILSAALEGEVGYVAALGSRRTQEARRDRLRGAGVDEDTIARLRGPAGLDIGSRTPAEIAVAIVAEMLSVRAASSGGALRDRTGAINAGALTTSRPDRGDDRRRAASMAEGRRAKRRPRSRPPTRSARRRAAREAGPSGARDLDPDVRRLDGRDGEHARLETELVGRLAAHERDHPVRSDLHLDLRHHGVADDRGSRCPTSRLRADAFTTGLSSAGSSVARSAMKRARSAPSTTARPESSLVVAKPPASAHRPHGVVADLEEGGDLADPQLRHVRRVRLSRGSEGGVRASGCRGRRRWRRRRPRRAARRARRGRCERRDRLWQWPMTPLQWERPNRTG